MGHVACVSNYKGGTGKTTSVVNIAAALAIRKKKVLIIDNDPQSDSTKAVLPRDSRIGFSLYHLLDLEAPARPKASECVYSTIHDNLFIIPNITETSGLEIPLAKQHPESNFVLRDAVRDFAIKHFDYTLIDCPPTLSIFVSNAMFASDFVIIPMDAGSGNSMDGVSGVLKLIDSVNEDAEHKLRFLRILINKIDKRKSSHKGVITILKDKFGESSIFKETIPTSSVFEEVELLKSASVFSHAARSKGAMAFRSVASEIISIFDSLEK